MSQLYSHSIYTKILSAQKVSVSTDTNNVLKITRCLLNKTGSWLKNKDHCELESLLLSAMEKVDQDRLKHEYTLIAHRQCKDQTEATTDSRNKNCRENEEKI